MNKEVLQQLGFTEYEATIYLMLLQQGHISAYQLAEKTGMYRQATYDALNRMVEKGYVSSVKEGKAQLFQAVSPELILELLQEKTESLKQILPDLISLKKQSSQPLMVETYKGKNVMRIALKDIILQLKKSGEVLCTAVDEFIHLTTHKTILEQYERDLIRLKIKERVIIKEGTQGLFNRGTSNYRTVSKKYFNPNPVQIYGDNVQIVLLGNPNYLIIIRSKVAADSYRKQFELMWNCAKS